MKNNNDSILKIKENYLQLERSIVAQLFLEVPEHQLTIGTYREKVWEALFRQILPKKFSIEQGVFIIDSNGQISKEVDLAVFDEQYTPYIFNYGNIKFVPIEAVAMVVQCKSHKVNNTNLQEWVDSISELKTSNKSIARIYSGVAEGELKVDEKVAQTATRPIKVLCHIKRVDEKGDDKQQTKVKTDLFDIVICGNEKDSKLNITPNDWTLGKWYEELNHVNSQFRDKHMKKYENEKNLTNFEVTDNTILSLIFQLNQLLMLINNPMLFPHQAYVEMFNK